MINLEIKEPSNKRFAFVNLSVSSQKELSRRNSETIIQWLNKQLCVDICSWKSAQSQYEKIPKLKIEIQENLRNFPQIVGSHRCHVVRKM